MGLSFSKSLKVGAVRFNFSGSGIGMSAGIPGLRIGTGPRGAYISGGIAGFRYRQSLNGTSRAQPETRAPRAGVPQLDRARPGEAQQPNISGTVVHETKNVLELQSSSSDELLRSMNEQYRRSDRWPFALGASVFLIWAAGAVANNAYASAATPLGIGVAALCLAFVLWLYWRDKLRRTTVLFYEPDQRTSALFETLSEALEVASSARKVKSIATTSTYRDTKYSAGAAQGLKFGDASLRLGQVRNIVANIDVPILTTGRTTLACYPDRILAFQGNAVGAVDYGHIVAASESVQFVEHEAVPADAKIVGRTWQYVNKSGGPDRRFKDNRELPVCLYNQLNVSTRDGLDVRFLSSKENGFDALVAALHAFRPGPG